MSATRSLLLALLLLPLAAFAQIHSTGTIINDDPNGGQYVYWTQPTKRADGTALTNLKSNRIWWGTTSGIYTSSKVFAAPTTVPARYNVGPLGLTQGTRYYFSISAIDAAGAESAVTDEFTAIAMLDDWATRSTAVGVIKAQELSTQAEINSFAVTGGTPIDTSDHIFLDTGIKPGKAAASVGFQILDVDTSQSGSISIPLGASFGDGAKFSYTYQVYTQPQDVFSYWPPINNTDSTASKFSILSRDAHGVPPIGSNENNEIVVQENHTGGMVSAYYQDGTAFAVFSANFSNPCANPDIVDTPQLNRGVPNPLTGVNPDTGAAWSSCEQSRAQFGSTHYSARSSPGVNNYVPGLGNPFPSGFRAYYGEWIAIAVGVAVGHLGQADNRVVVMAARQGQPWTLLIDQSGIMLGNVATYNGVTLLPYTTARVGGGRHVSARTGELATCFEIWNVTPSAALGSGTLSWNATAQRLSWQAPGEAAGTPRGFSVANDILAVNLISSGGSVNALNGKFNPPACPGVNATETVTIANSRPATQRNYSRFIVMSGSTMPTAPGGFASPVSL